MLALPSCTLTNLPADTRPSENNFLHLIFNSQNTSAVRISKMRRVTENHNCTVDGAYKDRHQLNSADRNILLNDIY